MIELELKYRDLVVQKSSNDQQFKGQINQTMGKNQQLSSQVENIKEQIHLL